MPTIRNIARGGGTYLDHRQDVFRELIDLGAERAPELSPFLSERFFKLRSGWTSFAFNDRDFRVLERLKKQGPVVSEANLLSLVQDYVRTNHESCREIQAANDLLSSRLLGRSEPEQAGIEFSPQAAPSLFAIKYACATQPTAAEAIRRTLERRFPRNSWVLTHLTYPLAFRFIAQPTLDSLKLSLVYLFPYDSQGVERDAMLLLLHEDAGRAFNLAFRLYVALMGHPYDACETILTYAEEMICDGGRLSSELMGFLAFCAQELNSRRAEDLLATISASVPFRGKPDEIDLTRRFQLTAEDAATHTGVLSLDTPRESHPNNTCIAILGRMQASAYPDPADFSKITATQNNWSFTDGGRYVLAALRSLYMIDRAAPSLERHAVLTLLATTRSMTPYLASAPSGMDGLRRFEEAGIRFSHGVDEIAQQTEAAIEQDEAIDDRRWIHRLQWTLRNLQEEGRIAQWTRTVRQSAPYRPSYLSGIDWPWVDEVLETYRLDYFLGFDGAYVLFLKEAEWPSDPTDLDTVLETLVLSEGRQEFVQALIDEYESFATALVRRLLTPANLILNALAQDHLTALDYRVKALEACIRRTGFDLLSREAYESEVKALTSDLLLSNLNSGKFEIPWATFRRDALGNFEDVFKVYESLRPALEQSGTQSSLTTIPVTFPNGRKEDYRIRVSETALFNVVTGIILDFFEHGAFGLEVILSGRFRHSKVQQELWAALPEFPRTKIRDIPPDLQNEIVALYRVEMEREVERWCNRRLHTKRDGKPDALFDIVPTQEEILHLLDAAKVEDSLEGIIDIVTDWLRDQLRMQVRNAGEHFVAELPLLLAESLEKLRHSNTMPDQATDGEILRVHTAVTEALKRRITDLQEWFGGIDTASGDAVNLEQLSTATALLLQDVGGDPKFDVRIDSAASAVEFTATQVKIAFDMLREIFFNVIKHGRASTTLRITRLGRDRGRGLYAFSNRSRQMVAKERRTQVRKRAYDDILAAIATEGNSGCLKIAASCSTILDEETEILAICRGDFFHLLLELPERR